MDHPTKRAQPDRSKINLHQPDELKYWARALKVSEEAIRERIRASAIGLESQALTHRTIAS